MINVGKEYNEGSCYWTTFYDCKGLIVDSGCPHTAEEPATFIEKMKLDVRTMMKKAASRLATLKRHDMNMKQPAGIINLKQRSIKHAKQRTAGPTSTTRR